jgi:uncharacterized protein YkwD
VYKRQGVISHDGFKNNCKQAGYMPCAENVLQNNDNSSNAGNAATTQWRNSAGHYENIMGNYKKIGLGYVRCRGGQVYWTGLFGG